MSESMAAELFRYHGWANRRLIDFCAALDPARLAIQSPTAYGSIHDTLAHVVWTDAYFTRCIVGDGLELPFEKGALPALVELAEWSDRTDGALVEAAASTPADRLVPDQRRGEGRTIPAAAAFAQALYHAGEHRAQVVAMLCDAGVRPPDLSGWRWGGDRSSDYDDEA